MLFFKIYSIFVEINFSNKSIREYLKKDINLSQNFDENTSLFSYRLFIIKILYKYLIFEE